MRGRTFWLPGKLRGAHVATEQVVHHPDAIVTGQSIWVDGRKIVEDGAIIGPPHLAKLAEKLAS